MTRKIYLIRHGRPDFPMGERRCLGTTDVPLGVIGRLQGCLLQRVMQNHPVSQVFCSNLSRSIETARYLTPQPTVIAGLAEADAGEWDGLSFTEIKARWPEIYERRGTDPGCPMPGSEDIEAAYHRFSGAVRQALDMSAGDIAIVAHATVMQSFLCPLLGLPLTQRRNVLLPYCSITTLEYDGAFRVMEVGTPTHPALDEALCAALLNTAETPAPVIAHCAAVADRAAAIAKELTQAGIPLDLNVLDHAARLHDMAKAHPHHPQTGAAWLKELGYPEIAALVEAHHDIQPGELTEAAVLAVADRCVRGTTVVPIDVRFRESLKKCGDDGARAAHARRWETARYYQEKINRICKKDVVL